jgi:DNA-directed RNA polymerase subunit K/omega
LGTTFLKVALWNYCIGEQMSRLTRFESTRVLSARALQLSLGAPPLVKRTSELSMLEVAEKEFLQKVLPLSVLRKFPNGRLKRIELFE